MISQEEKDQENQEQKKKIKKIQEFFPNNQKTLFQEKKKTNLLGNKNYPRKGDFN